MKLLVFAHKPPPHHGQSYMVQLLLDGLKGDADVSSYHINARFSGSMDDIGILRAGKFWLLLRYCAEAIWCRFRHNVRTFYYVPAPGKRAALYRDWLVMALCRPFFKKRIYHWHAVGLGDWLRDHGTRLERWITHWLLGRPDLGIALAPLGMRDALWFRSKRVELVPNGIPDPCPDFDVTLLPQRMARAEARRRREDRPLVETQRHGVLPLSASASVRETSPFRVLFLAHCTREKGVFDTLAAVRMLHEQKPGSIELTVAGAFLSQDEEVEFRKQLQPFVRYVGFVGGQQKDRLLREHDCFCFPTYYGAEGQPVNLIEAMAYGMNIVTTRWRTVPELLPDDFCGFVPIQSPAAVAEALGAAMLQDNFAAMRRHFLENYTAASHIRRLVAALSRR